MRIEHYGTVQAEPPYQHVGYTAAAVIASYSRFSSDMTFLFGALVLAVTLAAMAARRTRLAWRWPAVAAVLIVLAGAAIAHHTGHFETNSLQPQFYTTIYRLEDLSARTDAWIDGNGRAPTEAEWQAIEKGESELDGWQYPFQYQPLEKPGKDGQMYIITSIGKAPEKDERALRGMWAVHSWLLGPDGVFGTPDDTPYLSEVLAGVNLKGNRYPHAREPRR